MKKLLSLIVCVLMISGCQDASINRIKKDNSLSGLHEITYDELENKLSSDEIGRAHV